MTDAEPPITPDEYRRRLADLCARGGRHPFPRRSRDRKILLHALARAFEGVGPLGERDATARIGAWLEGTGRALDIDPVSLRRALVDEGFLDREPGGSGYRIGSASLSRSIFAAGVTACDPDQVVADARVSVVERRKRREALGRE